MMAPPPPGPLLSVRTALVLLIAVVVGLIAGSLGYFSSGGIATAALIGSSGAGSALLNQCAVAQRRRYTCRFAESQRTESLDSVVG
jgi:hypothetical protein